MSTSTSIHSYFDNLPSTCPAHGTVTIDWSSAWYGDRIALVVLSCGCTVTEEDR